MKRSLLILTLFLGISALAETASQRVPQRPAEADEAAATWGDVTCATAAGRRLCSQIRRFDSLLVDCNGYACYALWQDQIRAIDRLVDSYYYVVDAGDTVGTDVARLARSTARSLCAIRVTGDANWVSTLVVKYNQMIRVLKDIQEMAGTHAYSCKFSLD